MSLHKPGAGAASCVQEFEDSRGLVSLHKPGAGAASCTQEFHQLREVVFLHAPSVRSGKKLRAPRVYAPHGASLGQLADRTLEHVSRAYPADDSGFWTPPDFWDLAFELEERPCVWTDGSRTDYPTGGFEVAGGGLYLPALELAMEGAIWGHGGGVW